MYRPKIKEGRNKSPLDGRPNGSRMGDEHRTKRAANFSLIERQVEPLIEETQESSEIQSFGQHTSLNFHAQQAYHLAMAGGGIQGSKSPRGMSALDQQI